MRRQCHIGVNSIIRQILITLQNSLGSSVTGIDKELINNIQIRVHLPQISKIADLAVEGVLLELLFVLSLFNDRDLCVLILDGALICRGIAHGSTNSNSTGQVGIDAANAFVDEGLHQVAVIVDLKGISLCYDLNDLVRTHCTGSAPVGLHQCRGCAVGSSGSHFVQRHGAATACIGAGECQVVAGITLRCILQTEIDAGIDSIAVGNAFRSESGEFDFEFVILHSFCRIRAHGILCGNVCEGRIFEAAVEDDAQLAVSNGQIAFLSVCTPGKALLPRAGIPNLG